MNILEYAGLKYWTDVHILTVEGIMANTQLSDIFFFTNSERGKKFVQLKKPRLHRNRYFIIDST
jgi:hypothetical protein